MIAIGMMLENRYEILEKIGSGGMSDVYKAKCHTLNRMVAVKVLKKEFISDAGFVSKFKLEAQAAAGLSHPNIVSVYDVVDEGDLHFIVMELVEGITLKSYIKMKGHLNLKESIGIAIQVAQGMEAAHGQHIIHRDIKPQNMLISKDGKVKVADFGIARAVSSQTVNASAVIGSVHYISPEQARGGYSDERSDIYSFGITLYEMVTGEVPFEGDNTITVALAHLEEPMIPPSTLNPDVTPSLERVILKCTEKRPENRYPNAGEVILDLRRALLNPDDPVVGEGEIDGALANTRPITKKELDIIQGRSPVREDGNRERRDPGKPRTPRDPERGRDYSDSDINKTSRGIRETDSYTDRRLRDERDDRTDRDRIRRKEDRYEDESTQIEKILAGLGIVAAIVVVAVVIVIFSRLSGIFTAGNKTTAAVESTVESSGTDTSTVSDEGLSKKEVRVPYLIGISESEAEALLAAQDLEMQVEQENSDEVEKGIVISQVEKADSVVPRYSKVKVIISAGSDKVDLESLGLTEMSLDTAVRLLEAKGLKTTVLEEASETNPKGTIIRVEPADKAPLGSTVTLVISTGPPVTTVLVPALEGQAEEDALALLGEAGLVPGQVTSEYSDTVPAGSILRQGVAAGEELETGAAVDYVVSRGAEPPKTKFLASLEASYPLMVAYGPGAASSEIQILVRLKQIVNGNVEYTKLTEPKSYGADTTLNLRFNNIQGAYGVTTGEVEIVDLTNNVILTTYNLTFEEREV